MVVSGSCSWTHQLLLTLLPSIWWAAVAAPQRKPSGNCSVVMMVPFSACSGQCVLRKRSKTASVAAGFSTCGPW